MKFSSKGVAGAVALAVATVVAWWGWLGHDRSYQVDANGNQQGPYTTAQVAFCVLTIAVLLALAVRFLDVHPLPATAATTVAFTAAWTIDAASQDGSGLFLIGGVLVLIGCAVGSAVVAFLADLTRGRDGFTR
ncbi:hypothetical protein [Actinoplanes sp. NPDC089786]|uniref:hypothetical protein n=1 Tax=Actinoplanes sp. NPDC089786 TaxID=3155185 RepID=UPI003448D5FC